MKSTVRRDGDEYVLNGQKTFITNGPYADTIVVYAKLDEGDGAERRERKVLTFVLDSGMDGLTQSKPFKKMGMNSSPAGELFSGSSTSATGCASSTPRTASCEGRRSGGSS
jgi:alkylation response protein AidB-like acyl-CoA dehydrogenase